MPDNTQQSSSSHDADEADDTLHVQEDEFQAAFGESLAATLNLDTWLPGGDYGATRERMEREIAASVAQNDRIGDQLRNEFLPRMFARKQAPLHAGCYQVDPARIEQVHRGLLFTGAVEACDGTSLVHESLPLTIAQIGVSLVSYRGDQGTWLQRLYRRDLRVTGLDPIEEAFQLLERRRKRDSTDAESTRDRLTELTRRGIMAYAERAILAEKSQALWRMGHGNPMPYELLTGGGLVQEKRGGGGNDMPLLRESFAVWRKLLLEHKKWIYVPSAPANRAYLTAGYALHPLEFALIDTPTNAMLQIVDGHLPKYLKDEAKAVVNELGPQITVGVYRASASAPPYIFYAHRDYACQAALIVLADSVLQEHRGFPMLIDLADLICRSTFGSDTFTAIVQQAYTHAGAPFTYLRERETRA